MKLRGYKRKLRRELKRIEAKGGPLNGLSYEAKQERATYYAALPGRGLGSAHTSAKKVKGPKIELTDAKVDQAIFEEGHGSRTTLREAAHTLGVHPQRLRRFVRRPGAFTVTDNYQSTAEGELR
jgi:hypothetical protein